MTDAMTIIAIGTISLLLGFFYSGSYNKAMPPARRKPDNPPNMLMRAIFIIIGLVALVIGLARM